jgi:hypothetical protein
VAADTAGEVVAAGTAVVDPAVNELIAELVSATEWDDAVVDVVEVVEAVEVVDTELSCVVLCTASREMSSVVCWYAVIVVPFPVWQPYEKKE